MGILYCRCNCESPLVVALNQGLQCANCTAQFCASQPKCNKPVSAITTQCLQPSSYKDLLIISFYLAALAVCLGLVIRSKRRG